MKLFLDRERQQGAHLRKALSGRYQKICRNPPRELRRLSRIRVRSLIAHNPYSRCRWIRAVVEHLGALVGAVPPRYHLPQSLYFVTVIDRRQIVNPDLEMNSREVNPTFEEMRSAYRVHLRGFDYFGMLDTALFVSAQRAFRKVRFVHFHLHALVWNTDEAALEAAKQRARRTIHPLFSYVSPFDYQRVEIADFLQLVWYVNKTPRKQYQVHLRETGRWKQFKRGINGVNSVRLYDIMRDATLDELALADGRGIEVLKRVLLDVQRR